MCERKLDCLSNRAEWGKCSGTLWSAPTRPRRAQGVTGSDPHPYPQPFTRAEAPHPCVNIMHDMAQLLWTQISQIHVAYLETPVKKPQPLDGSDQ